VTVASPPVVNFTVNDGSGNPAEGIASGHVWFTFVKLVPNTDPAVNGGLPYWQNYVNRVEDVANNVEGRGSDFLDLSIQATTDSSGALVETAPGVYQYTFATDVTNVTSPIAVAWEPDLCHRVGLEIRLDGPGETPLAPFNPVFDFVPETGGDCTGVSRNILSTDKCEGCHYEFAFHGGPRKSMEYCVTCHNRGTVDQDSGNSLDFAHLLHSVHMGDDRDPSGLNPFKIWGYADFEHDYSEVHFPQSKTFCETCHDGAVTEDGDAWNEGATAKTCGGCHFDGLVAANFDAVTGEAEYQFDHAAAEAAGGSFGAVTDDGQCASCHLGSISTAGPPLAIHSTIRGDQRARKAAGDPRRDERQPRTDPNRHFQCERCCGNSV
jgi:OmcA/MtrC family decaheme c-type cytochrome